MSNWSNRDALFRFALACAAVLAAIALLYR